MHTLYNVNREDYSEHRIVKSAKKKKKAAVFAWKGWKKSRKSPGRKSNPEPPDKHNKSPNHTDSKMQTNKMQPVYETTAWRL